jgi:acetylornithine/succinyldiaminopimelate/putrescine aminotransferase
LQEPASGRFARIAVGGAYPEPGSEAILRNAHARGLLWRNENTVRFAPPLVIKQEEIDYIERIELALMSNKFSVQGSSCAFPEISMSL